MSATPFTILFHEGPIARAYLVVLRHLGIRPDHIIEVVPKCHPATGRSQYAWIPSRYRPFFARKTSFASIHYWPKVLAPRYAPSVICGDQPFLNWTEAMLQEMRSPVPLDRYSDRVSSVLATGINDRPVIDALSQEPAGTKILFTGGGLIKEALRENTHLDFVHVHPGVLPYVRGADGVLWSVALRGCPGASVFLMDLGLDTGDILYTNEFPRLALGINGPLPEAEKLYRILFSFLDPIIRATTLYNFLNTEDVQWTGRSQPSGSGIVNHFMHARLADIYLKKVIYEKGR